LPQPFRGFGHIAIGFFQLPSYSPSCQRSIFFAQLLTTCTDISAILPVTDTTKSHCLPILSISCYSGLSTGGVGIAALFLSFLFLVGNYRVVSIRSPRNRGLLQHPRIIFVVFLCPADRGGLHKWHQPIYPLSAIDRISSSLGWEYQLNPGRSSYPTLTQSESPVSDILQPRLYSRR